MSAQPSPLKTAGRPIPVPGKTPDAVAPGAAYLFKLLLPMILLLAGIAALWLRPYPAVVQATVAANEFSAQRAAQYVKAIAKAPHATGTAANDAVRAYIVNELTRMDAGPRIQEADVLDSVRGGYRMIHVHNIIGRLVGAHSSGAVLLVAHYDSAQSSLGAADDGAGVATLLETLSDLRAGSALNNDVILLFTDGEELATKGAEAFSSDPVAKQVKVVLNFEARGTSGRSVMFESRGDDGWLVRALISVAPHAWASSLAPSLYQLTDNDTDYTRFKQGGIPGLNFAFVEGWQAYHTALDRPDQLDLRSLQHHGSYALSMTRYLGNADLASPRPKEETIYFNLIGSLMVVYSAGWAVPLSIFVMLAFVVVALAGIRKGIISTGGALLAFVVIPVSGIAAVLISRTVLSILYGASKGQLIFEAAFFIPAVVLAALSIYLLLQAWLSRKRNLETIMTGGLIWWVLLCLASGIMLKGASYVFTWPTLCGIAVLGWRVFRGSQSGWQRVVPYLLLLPSIVLLVPFIDNLLSIFLMVGSAAVAFFIVLGLPFYAMPLNAITGGSAKASAWTGVPAILLFAAALLDAHPSGSHPMFDYVFLIWNSDTHQGIVATQVGPTDGYTAQLFGRGSSTAKLASIIPAWFGELPASDMRVAPIGDPALSPPAVEKIEAANDGKVWHSSFRIRSLRHAPQLSVRLISTEDLSSISVNGKPVTLPNPVGSAGVLGTSTLKEANLVLLGSPNDGWVVTVSGQGNSSLKMVVADRSYDLPYGSSGVPARPPSFIPDRFTSDSTFISRAYSF